MTVQPASSYKDIIDIKNKNYLEELNPEVWQINLLKKNSSDSKGIWSVGADGLNGDDIDTWKEFVSGYDYNLEDHDCVDYQFLLNRDTTECEECFGMGIGENIKNIYLNINRYHLQDNISNDEFEYLKSIGYFNYVTPNSRYYLYDGFTIRCIAKYRAMINGSADECKHCHGRGYHYDTLGARAELQLWFTYPRKGRSFGLRILEVEQDDIQSIINFLSKANRDNNLRFNTIHE